MSILTLTAVGAGQNAVTFYLPEPLTNAYPRILNALATVAKDNGAIDVVPAYNSVLVIFDPHLQAPENIKQCLEEQLPDIVANAENTEQQRIVRVPVCYDEAVAPDLARVAEIHGLTTEMVIERHLAETYSVCCLGFIPGFAFLGYVDDCIATPRHATPRPNVAGGSLGIAGKQTGFYPVDAPGGWNLIGRTPKTLYNPENGVFSCFEIGDNVQCYRIDYDAFLKWEETI